MCVFLQLSHFFTKIHLNALLYLNMILDGNKKLKTKNLFYDQSFITM